MYLEGPRDSCPQGTTRCSETQAGPWAWGRPPPAGLPSYPLGWAILSLVTMAEENSRPLVHSSQSQAWSLPLPPPTLPASRSTGLLCYLGQLPSPL